jgi:hypothetical protein
MTFRLLDCIVIHASDHELQYGLQVIFFSNVNCGVIEIFLLAHVLQLRKIYMVRVSVSHEL